MSSTSASTDPVDCLRRLVVACRTRRMPADVAAWLEAGITAYRTGAAPDLEHALELRGRPGRTGRARQRLALETRDAHLRVAAAAMDASDRPTAVARAVASFARTFPSCAAAEHPPARFNAAQCALWHAFKSGAAVPLSSSGIRAALRTKTPSVHSAPPEAE